MKRSTINTIINDARACFAAHGWTLPPKPRWDVCDFGYDRLENFGLVLVNLCEEAEYCEKLMYAKKGMVTLRHGHAKKKEDIISRWGRFGITLWDRRHGGDGETLSVQIDGEQRPVIAGEQIEIPAGSRITLCPGSFHSFVPLSDECIIGEVSTANDDVHDNIFTADDVARFPSIEEDVAAEVRLISET
jgi:D-lyxose ketol-isomerase